MPKGYPREAQVASNRQSTAGMIDMRIAELSDVYTDDAQAVKLSTEYLRRMIDMAERIEDHKSGFWLLVERDVPVMLIPEDSESDLAYATAPRIGNDDDSPLDSADLDGDADD